MAKSKLVAMNQKIEDKVVGGYKKIEASVVGGFEKIEDAFVDQYLSQENETIAEAKARLKQDKSANQD